MNEEQQAVERCKRAYDAGGCLKRAAELLYKNKKMKVEISGYDWRVSVVSEKVILQILYSADGREVKLNVLETIFRDYDRPVDKLIGIPEELDLKSKTVLRLAYLLYTHRKD